MSIYEANSIPPRSQRLRLLTYFSLARHPGTDNNFEYIEKYPALPSPTLSKRTSDAPPRSIILSARQSPRDRGGGGLGGNRGSNRENPHYGAPPNCPIFCHYIRYPTRNAPSPINACTCTYYTQGRTKTALPPFLSPSNRFK